MTILTEPPAPLDGYRIAWQLAASATAAALERFPMDLEAAQRSAHTWARHGGNEMDSRWRLIVALAMVAPGATVAHAAPGGVQWTPDSARILVNKDVGAERWAITLNLADVSATGNVFFVDGRSPAFIWCEKITQEFEPSIGELTLQYRCFGSDAAEGGFGLDDWDLISDEVFLPASFFIPPAETCDLRNAVSGPNAQNATSFWECNGNGGTLQFQVFGDGTGVSTATGPFEFDVIDQACTFGRLSDGSFLDLEYSPSRDRLTLYEITPAVDQFTLSECYRTDL